MGDKVVPRKEFIERHARDLGSSTYGGVGVSGRA